MFFLFSCAGISQENVSQKGKVQKPKMIPHSEWQKTAPVGFAAEGTRKNIAPAESITYGDFKLDLVKMTPAEDGKKETPDKVAIKLSLSTKSEEKTVDEGTAFNWEGYHIAILAAHTAKGELGGGLTEFEITKISSIPKDIADSKIAGDAKLRARIPHKIDKITLHHSGDDQPSKIGDDIPKKLNALMSWGMKDKNWWDVPYHFLIGPDGTIYEGRDYHYIGETNTKYDTTGHFLISVIGNYDKQEATKEQIDAITDLMAWAAQDNNVSPDQIYGHSDLAETACPGKSLKVYLKDGTFKNGVKKRLGIESK